MTNSSNRTDPVSEEAEGPVLVTGGNGYVASWLVKTLLDRGTTVHATVRDAGDPRRTGHLRRLADRAPGRLRLFEAELMDGASFDAALSGCTAVFHTASPFVVRGVSDPMRELIAPARDGTRNVLEAAGRAGSVTRVVLTSSVAAVYGDAADLRDTAAGRFDESHWNHTSSARHQPYFYSKTLAERTAWEIAERQDRWTLAVVNPGFVTGPALSPHATSESVALVRDFGSGRYRMGVPALDVGVVDVRDVAEGHVRAAGGGGAGARHILVAETLSLLEMGRSLRARFGNRYPFPRITVPKPVCALVAPFLGTTLKFVSRNVGYPVRFDNQRARQSLGMTFRRGADSVIDHFQQLLDDGLLSSRDSGDRRAP
ncbi:MAG: NAD-dependent epimerase/dehydratase family protein [Nitrospira sp.]|nr:NAD-dependent epimerase/dehydratase family protein [Nitrospira sp.]